MADKNMLNMNVFDGKKIKKIRLEKEMSRIDLARAAGVHIRTLEDWERNKRGIADIENLNNIAKVLRCSLQDFCVDDFTLRIKKRDYIYLTAEELKYLEDLLEKMSEDIPNKILKKIKKIK